MDNNLIYVRPWNRDQFLNLASLIWPSQKVVEVSEHRSVDRDGLSDEFYSAFKGLKEGCAPRLLNSEEASDVILRCRLLRALDPELANHIVTAMEHAIEVLLDKHNPNNVLSVTVDSYIQHLLVLACKRRNITFIGLIPSFVNGYFRITSIGERVASQEVDESQVDQVLEKLLVTEYKPDFLAKSPAELRQKARKLWLRNLPKPLWFALRRRLSGDPMNYHYWSTEVVARNYWSPKLQDYTGNTPSSIEDIPEALRSRPLVFLPLQMSPEATVDYWSSDAGWIDYENQVCKLIDNHSESHTFLVKEHPNLLGYRNGGFYNRLLQKDNCLLIAPQILSNEMISLSDAVVICTGTVGFEAALRGVPVYSDSDPFHLPRSNVLPIASLSTEITPKATDREQQRILVRYVLDGLLPGRFVNDGSWHKSLHDQSQMAASISSYLSRLSP